MDLRNICYAIVIYLLLLLQWPANANILAQKIDLHGHTYDHEDIQKMLEKLYRARQPDVSLEEFESVNSLLTKFFKDPEVNGFRVLVSEIIFQSRRSLLFNQRCEGTQFDVTNVNLPNPGPSYETYITFPDPGISYKSVISLPDPGTSYYKAYLKLRDTLLNSGHFFCDPLRGLECSSSRKCDCRQGSVWNSTVSKCFLPPGLYCPHDQEWVDREKRTASFYYQYLKITEGPTYGRNIDVFKSSNVTQWSGVSSQKKFINCASPSKCTLSTYFLLPVCTDPKVNDNFQFVTSSSFGETCKESEHRILFTPTGAQNTNSRLRRQTLNELQRSRTRFCDASNLLTCGSSGTCTCIGQFTHNGSQCVGPPEDYYCEDNNDFNKIFRDNTAILPIWRGDAASARQKLVEYCGPVYNTCWSVGSNPLSCGCPKSRTAGINCEQKLSNFFVNSIVPSTSLPADIPTLQEKHKIFGQLNEAANTFETIFRVNPGGRCKEPERWWDIKRVVLYLQQIGIYGRNDSWTKKNYTDIIAKVKELTQLYQHNYQICNLLFHPTIKCNDTGLCEAPYSFNELDKLYKRLKGLGKSLGEACAMNFSDLNFESFESVNYYVEVEFYWLKGIFTYCNETARLYCKEEVEYSGSGFCALLPSTKTSKASESIILHPHLRAYMWGFLLLMCFTLY